METPVEIRYQGVVVGSATEILRAPGNDAGMFLVMPDPLPVGTVVKLGATDWGRVEKVVESPDPRGAGMYVRLVAEGEAQERWVPQLPEMVPLPPPRRAPTPAGVPLVSPRVAEVRPTVGENGERRATIAGPIPPPVAPERSAGIVLATPPQNQHPPATPPHNQHPHNQHPADHRQAAMSGTLTGFAPAAPAAPAGRERRNTLVVAVPPPSEPPPSGPIIASAKASGEFQSRPPTPVPGVPVPPSGPVAATIVVTPEPELRDGTVMSPMENAPSEDVTPAPDEGASLDTLRPARPLPPPDGRRKTSRRRRNTSK
jgi:hypothetical protein